MKFKELLDEVDKSGAQLARYLGVSVSAVSAWCTGKSAPSYDKLPKIANFFGVSVMRVLNCFI